MTVLFATHAAYLEHLVEPGHVESPTRLDAVLAGARVAGLDGAVVPLEPQPATMADLSRVHTAEHLEHVSAVCAGGGGRLDPDTSVSEGSWRAALLAAGAGVSAVQALRHGSADAAFCAVRPPGHHATAAEAMGFCLLNNVAVVAALLADEGERVMIVDYDVHHGNGTQAIFSHDPRVLFVSIHGWPLYPGTGRHVEVGEGPGRGTTLNIPLPHGATGDVMLYAFDQLIAPIAERFAPTWVLVSAGFDGHRDDPIGALGLSAGDYAPLTRRIVGLVPPGRRLVMLEGGYHLDALRLGTATVLRELAGAEPVAYEPPTEYGPGHGAVRRTYDHWAVEGLL